MRQAGTGCLTLVFLIVIVAGIVAAAGGGNSNRARHVAHRHATTHRATADLSRHQVCQHLARFVGNYDYIQQHTSVRAYDILYHSLQVSCPKETQAAQLVGVTNRPPCRTLYESRFTCQAVHDPYLSSLATSDLRADLPNG